MQIKSIAMLAAAGCVIGVLTGCGVPQKKHDRIVAELNAAAQASEDALKATLADTKSALQAEQTKSSQLQSELKDSSARIEELKGSVDGLTNNLAAEKSKVSQLESDLSAVKATVSGAQQKASEAEKARDKMEQEKQQAQRRFDMLRAALLELNKKSPADLQINLDDIMSNMGAPSSDTGSTEQSAPAASGTESVKGLLDQMDNM